MKHSNPRIHLTIVALVACSLALPSCGKKDKDDQGEDKKTASYKGAGGVEIKSGQSVKLPDDWPDDIPIADGITIKMLQKMPPLGHNLVTHSSKEGKDIVSYYKKEMSAAGWEEENVMDLPNGGMLSYSKGERRLSIAIASSPNNPTSVTFQLVAQKAGQ